MTTRILTINSLDIQGRFGINADCRTATLCDAEFSSVATGFNSPKLDKLKGAPEISADFLKEQLKQIFATQQIDAIKIGLVPTIDMMQVINEFLLSLSNKPPVVLDPVFLIGFGDGGNVDFAEYLAAYKRYLAYIVELMIPSVQEAEQFIGTHIDSFESARHAASMLQTMGTQAILLKGAQIPSPESMDFFISDQDFQELAFTKTTQKPNDLGISLSTAITVHLARGMNIFDAVVSGKDFIQAHLKDEDSSEEIVAL